MAFYLSNTGKYIGNISEYGKMKSKINEIPQFLRPDRYLLVIFAFFIIFPVFVDLITPDTAHDFAYGTVNSEVNEIYKVEGGDNLQYQWYYPVIYPFMLVWYVSIIIYTMVFNLIEYIIPLDLALLHGSLEILYFYVLSAFLSVSLKKLAAVKKIWGENMR